MYQIFTDMADFIIKKIFMFFIKLNHSLEATTEEKNEFNRELINLIFD